MVERTLEGERLIVYVLMKILKKVTGADVTSYLVKYAVNEMLENFAVKRDFNHVSENRDIIRQDSSDKDDDEKKVGDQSKDLSDLMQVAGDLFREYNAKIETAKAALDSFMFTA